MSLLTRFHCPGRLQSILFPRTVFQLQLGPHIVGYVSLNVDGSNSRTQWLNGIMEPLNDDLDGLLQFLDASNNAQPPEELTKLCAIEVAAQIANVYAENGQRLEHNYSFLENSSPSRRTGINEMVEELVAKPEDVFPATEYISFQDRCLWWLEHRIPNVVFDRFGRVRNRALQGLEKVDAAARAHDEHENLIASFLSKGMNARWHHVDSMRAFMLKSFVKPSFLQLVSGTKRDFQNINSFSNLFLKSFGIGNLEHDLATKDTLFSFFNEQNWYLREKVTDSFYLKHAIQLPVFSKQGNVYSIDFKWRKRGLLAFHPDPMYANLSYMKAPPILAKNSEQFARNFLADALSKLGKSLDDTDVVISILEQERAQLEADYAQVVAFAGEGHFEASRLKNLARVFKKMADVTNSTKK